MLKELTAAYDQLTLLFHEANRKADTPVKDDAITYAGIADQLETAISALDVAREALTAETDDDDDEG